MFREMRRHAQQLTQDESIQILRSAKTGILAVQGDDGYPYTVPINLAYEDGKVYFHGAKIGHKYDAMRRCEKVSLCVIGHDEVIEAELTTYFRSVILFGSVRILSAPNEIFHAAQVLARKYCSDEARINAEIQREMQALCCFEIRIEHLTGKEALELARRRTAGREEAEA